MDYIKLDEEDELNKKILQMNLVSKGLISASSAIKSLGISMANTMEEFAFEQAIIGLSEELINKYLSNKNHSLKLKIKIAEILKLNLIQEEKDIKINLLLIES